MRNSPLKARERQLVAFCCRLCSARCICFKVAFGFHVLGRCSFVTRKLLVRVTTYQFHSKPIENAKIFHQESLPTLSLCSSQLAKQNEVERLFSVSKSHWEAFIIYGPGLHGSKRRWLSHSAFLIWCSLTNSLASLSQCSSAYRTKHIVCFAFVGKHVQKTRITAFEKVLLCLYLFHSQSLWSMHAKARPCFQNFTPTGTMVLQSCTPPSSQAKDYTNWMFREFEESYEANTWKRQCKFGFAMESSTPNCRVQQFSNDQPLENKLLELWAYCSPSENKFLATVLATGNGDADRFVRHPGVRRPAAGGAHKHIGFDKENKSTSSLNLSVVLGEPQKPSSQSGWWQDFPVLPSIRITGAVWSH